MDVADVGVCCFYSIPIYVIWSVNFVHILAVFQAPLVETVWKHLTQRWTNTQTAAEIRGGYKYWYSNIAIHYFAAQCDIDFSVPNINILFE